MAGTPAYTNRQQAPATRYITLHAPPLFPPPLQQHHHLVFAFTSKQLKLLRMATTVITAPITTTTLLDTSAMASKRLPLASVPNAINSPYRSTAKRTRAQAGDTKELEPPAKKQLLERFEDEENVDPQRQHYFLKRPANTQPTALERKFAASREKKPTPEQRAQKISADSLESIRQWQRHYRRQFPHFVFYFDNTPEDVRVKLVRQLQMLGSREEKFFSSVVTHVVTARHIPAEVVVEQVAPTNDKVTSMLDNTIQRRDRPADVLNRARELNIKIWALEKVQRVLKTMFEAITGEQGEGRLPASEKLQKKDADLEQLLRNEKINGDAAVAAQDMVTFKGCYIYIHDMDEKTKPVMIRDYAKPQHRDEGKWPQFRVSGLGRCPFVEDPIEMKRQESDKKVKRAKTDTVPLAERASNLRRSPRKVVEKEDLAKPLDPPKLVPTKRSLSTSEAPVFASTQIQGRGPPRMIGGMPIASGMQHSNVTSAIRSQVISSAAISSTAPGMTRRPDSKEVSVLKRKVLERTTSVPSQPPSSYMNDMRAAINEDVPPPRAAKRRAQENILGVVPEEKAVRQKRTVKKVDPKPGYCENCRDKFDDFEEHIHSRKHQRFARTADNWKELDDLLRKLKRTHKES